VGKPEGEILYECSGCRWEDNIELHLKVVGWEAVDSIHVAVIKKK
jgi:hypothetical protein